MWWKMWSMMWSALALMSSHDQITPGSSITQCQGQEGLECPSFTVTFFNEDYEIRQYASSKWVSSSVRDVEPEEYKYVQLFRKLFNYISGENSQSVDIPMTAPVKQLTKSLGEDTEKADMFMSFYVPQAFQDSTPTPTDSDVYLESAQSMTFYVRAFDGFADEEVCAEQFKLLIESIGDASKFVQGQYFTAGYDSPYTVFNRRNEVWLLATDNQ